MVRYLVPGIGAVATGVVAARPGEFPALYRIDKKNLVRLKERYEVKFCIDHHPDSRIDTTPYLYGLRLQEIRNAISNANKGRTPYAKEGKPQQVIYVHGDTVKYVDAVTLYFDKVCPPADVDPQAPPAVIVLDKRGDETIEGQEWGFQPEIQKFMLSQKPFAEALNAACNIVMRTDLLTCNDQKLDIMERVAREREADVERLRSNLLELRKVGFDWAAIKAMISENTEEKFVVAWQRWTAFVWRSVEPNDFCEHPAATSSMHEQHPGAAAKEWKQAEVVAEIPPRPHPRGAAGGGGVRGSERGPPADVDPQAPPAAMNSVKRGNEIIEVQGWEFQPEIQKLMLSQKRFADSLNAACDIVMRTALLTCHDENLDSMETVARERGADIASLRGSLTELRKRGHRWAEINAMISPNSGEKFVVAWKRWTAFVWRSVDPMGFYEHWIPLRPHARGVSLGPFHHPWVPKVEERIMFVCYAVTPGDIPASRGISFPMLIASSADWVSFSADWVSSSAVGVSSCTAYSDSCLSTWRAHPP